MKKKVSILGSTGSIGTQALEVISKLQDDFEVVSLCAGNNIELLREQIKKFSPRFVSVGIEENAEILSKEFPLIKFNFGDEGLCEASKIEDNDIVLVALSGKAGLKPTLAAIETGKDIALANKETLVMAGDIVMKRAREKGVKILPVDSEHSAIFQCLDGRNDIKNLIITSSGGPFRTWTKEQMRSADLSQALNHPRWNMGKKITVDSATLMNKGLEVIEAHHLFNVDYKDIKVVVHPQSYLHSAVEYFDGSIIGQMGIPSMHIPIQYALTYPKRVEGIETGSFDFVTASKLEFFEPDFEKFPCLKLAFEAGKTGGTSTVCLNASNEEAVYAFLRGEIGFCDIYEVVKTCMDSYSVISEPAIEQILSEDAKIREFSKKVISSLKVKG
ncbi:1-deoxy-D-xylulose-5-phosphate reductoisomerase [bacterium]|nr:1-deoxy-D-xylulose-5-phosphate reductoisomerase [bacterium]